MPTATLTTTVKLSTDQLKKLSAAIEKRYGKNIEIKEVIDKSILGGIIVTVDSHQLDNSYRARIQSYKQHAFTAIAK